MTARTQLCGDRGRDRRPDERQAAHRRRDPEPARAYRSERVGSRRILRDMCRNITTLRGLEPQATAEEIEAAARQYVRKVSGIQSRSMRTDESFERAVKKVTEATAQLLDELPARRQPPPTLPPLRRLSSRQQ